MEIPAPQFAFGDTVEPTSDQAIRPKSRVGRVEGRRWVMDPVSGPAHWRCTVRWPEGGTSDQPEKTLQAADLVMCDLEVVISGAPFKIETSTTATVEELIELATAKAGIPHPDTPQNPIWELRTAEGRQLTHLVGDAKLVDGETTLFLDPQVGGGGDDAPTEALAELVSGGERPAWAGEPPAKGTRRALIRDAIYRELEDYFGPKGALVSREFFALKLADAVEAELLKDFGIARACRDCATEQLEHGAKEVDGRRDDTIKSLTLRCDSLLAQRESARAGEDHFKAQRDAALHLLRWLIGDIIPPDLIRLGEEEQG